MPSRAGDVVSDEHELIGLLHRADWTRLSLSAEVSDGSTLLVAPGIRYRYDSPDYVTGCDGDRPWELYPGDEDEDSSAHWVSGPEAPLPELLCPARLLEDSVLEVQGRTQACGRDAIDVTVTGRPDSRGHGRGARRDAPAGPPAGDDLLRLLHAGGRSEFAATLHQWTGLGALAASVPQTARRAGFGGLGLLMDAIADVPSTSHLVSRVRVAGPGRYQIDHTWQPRRGAVTIACDGERRWQVYPDKITVGPARPLPSFISQLADPSWLLRCWLASSGILPPADGPALRISAARRRGEGASALMFPAAVAVLDTDLGLVRRLTSYIGTRPVQRYELRDIDPDVAGFEVELPAGLPVIEEPPFRTG